MSIQLSRTERWILSNQYRLLELNTTDKGIKAEFQKAREVLENGYEWMYSDLCENIYTDHNVMTESECLEVLEILEMFSRLNRKYDELKDKTGINEAAIRFAGFDGNSESKYMGFARFWCRPGSGNYVDLVAKMKGDNFNSHASLLDSYRRMLEVWKPLSGGDLSKEAVLAITAAAVHPSRR